MSILLVFVVCAQGKKTSERYTKTKKIARKLVVDFIGSTVLSKVRINSQT